jgi:hypothetical protein
MNNLDTSLLCLEIKSLGMGYRALSLATQESAIRVLEAAPAGDRFLILLLGASQQLHEVLKNIRQTLDGTGAAEILDAEIVEKIDPEVLEGIYSLTQNELSESLVVAECATVSSLLSVAQVLTTDGGLKLIELKIKRAAPGGAWGLFTGSLANAEPAAEKVRTRFQTKMREGKIEVIAAPNESFRSFFNFSGKA